MKIQIVHLEAHDDVTSTRDKMGWGQTSRILLIWPSKGAILDRQLDLILLQRRSQAIGAQLSLVTRDEVVCFNAAQLGIPTFPSLRKAQSPRRGLSASGRYQRPRRSRLVKKLHPRPLRSRAELMAIREQARPRTSALLAHPAVRLSAFTLGLLALLALWIVIIPGASIELEPIQEIQHLTLPITASTNYILPKLTGEVPAHWVSVVVEARDSIPTTGKLSIPQKAATGVVKFTNLTGLAVEIPAGTVVRTIGSETVRFVTNQIAKIPAGSGRYEYVSIRALSPGASSNVAADTIQLVEGDLGLKVNCTNPSALTNGGDQPVPGPSEADRKQLLARLSKDLETTALQELKTSNRSVLSEGDFPILNSLKLIRVLEQNFQPEAGFPSEQLELTLRLEFQALVVSAQDLLAVVKPVMEASLPEGSIALADTLQVEPVHLPVMVGAETARWQANVSQTIQATIPPEIVIQAVRGLPADQAAAQLFATLPLAQQPLIQVFPSWWPYLPFAPMRIEVN